MSIKEPPRSKAFGSRERDASGRRSSTVTGNRNMEVSNRNMSYNERLRKASKYCERNGSYRVIAGCGEKKLLLVRNATGYVRTALLGE